MEDKTTIDRVRACVAQLIGPGEQGLIRDDADMAEDYGMDSLDRLTLAMALEEEFQIDIPDKDVDDERMGTIAGMAAYLDGRAEDWGGSLRKIIRHGAITAEAAIQQEGTK